MTDNRSPDGAGSAWIAWGVSILNGAFGDYLRARRNGLAIEMALYHQNRPFAPTRADLNRVHPRPTAKICVMIHGLGCNESSWTFRDPAQPDLTRSYGALLQAELGYTPFYVRYNTGLSIAENGKNLALLLDNLLAFYPMPVTEITLIGHSMGGLVLRSACHYGSHRQSAWIERVQRVFYLGTPHEGADLAKLAHVATTALYIVPNPITHLIGDILNLRSQGVKDLRSGVLLDEDVADIAAHAPTRDQEQTVPWLAHAHHYLIVGTLTEDPQHVVSLILGDALVRPPGSFGQTGPGAVTTLLPAEHIMILPGINHMALANDPTVYQQIKRWCIQG